MTELDGLGYFSSGARLNNKRVGGAAVVVDNRRFAARKLDIAHPKSIEVVWLLVRPKIQPPVGEIREFATCSFYSPPNKGRNNPLIQHIVENMMTILKTYPKAGVVIAGDANKMDFSQILRAAPHFRQIVTKPTHYGGILDIII